ncbi:MAG: O-antigen ligase family protein [Saccharospirillum sp.]
MTVKKSVFPSIALLYLVLYPFAEAYLLSVFLLLAMSIFQHKHFKSSLVLPILWPLILGLSIAFPLTFALIESVNPKETINDILRFSVMGLVATIFVSQFDENRRPDIWLTVLGAVVAFWIADALLQYSTGHNVMGYPTRSNRLTGLWYPSIAVGTVTAHIAPVFIESIRRLTLKHGGWSHCLWVLVLPILAVVALGGSRASWVAFVLLMGIYGLYLLYIRYLRFWWIVLVIVAGGVAAIVMYYAMPEFQTRIDRTLLLFSGDFDQINHATSGRLPIWSAAWIAFLENPWFGIGSDALKDFAAQNGLSGVPVRYAHFYLLDVLSMTGLLGLFGYSLFYVVLTFHGIQSMRKQWDIAAVFFICAWVMAFPANTHWGFYNYRPVGLLWLFIAMAYALRYRSQLLERGNKAPAVS